uniref:Uncharacterized protein n=1 Tax=Haemonchus contortus TaxID=6289 RepID=A0A7I4XWA8_HAECO
MQSAFCTSSQPKATAEVNEKHSEKARGVLIDQFITKNDLKEIKVAVLDEIAETRKNIRKTLRNFTNHENEVLLTKQLQHLQRQWRRSSTTSTIIFSTTTFNWPPTISRSTLLEGQNCEQARFRKGLSEIDTKMPLSIIA